MRKLIGLLITLAVLATLLSIADVFVKDRVQSALAQRVEQQFPGSRARVQISSFPFIGRLAASGSIPEVQLDVTGMKPSSDMMFSRVHLEIDGLMVKRSKLLGGHVVPVSVTAMKAVGTIPAARVGLAADGLGDGTAMVSGRRVPVTVSVAGGLIEMSTAGREMVRFPLPVSEVLPCATTARIVPGALQVTCTSRAIPGILSDINFSL